MNLISTVDLPVNYERFDIIHGVWQPRQEMVDWLNQNIGLWAHSHSRFSKGAKFRWRFSQQSMNARFFFKSRADAMLFKLTWGGQ